MTSHERPLPFWGSALNRLCYRNSAATSSPTLPINELFFEGINHKATKAVISLNSPKDITYKQKNYKQHDQEQEQGELNNMNNMIQISLHPLKVCNIMRKMSTISRNSFETTCYFTFTNFINSLINNKHISHQSYC